MEYGLEERRWNVQTCKQFEVLILVLMEYGLEEADLQVNEMAESGVLILVLMEYGLEVIEELRARGYRGS